MDQAAADTISHNAWLGFDANETRVEGEQGMIDAHKAAEQAQFDVGNVERAAEHTKEIARREAGRVDLTGVVSHKEANVAAHTVGGALLQTQVRSLKVQS